MFTAFYETNPDAFPMEFSQLSNYIWLQQGLLALFMTWFFDNEIFDSILTGNIAYEMARPLDLFSMWFTKNCAIRVSRVVLRLIPIFIVATLLPQPYNMTLPSDFLTFILFIISLILGLFVTVAFSLLIHISAFYTISPNGIKLLAVSLLELLTGALIPIPFFPEALQKVMFLLPFASMQSSPFLIYIGQLDTVQALQSMALQLFWVVFLVGIGKLFMRKAIKKVVVQGG